MPDPRNVVSVNGVKPFNVTAVIDGVSITHDAAEAGGSAQTGLAVRLVPGTEKTIELVGDGEAVFGKLLTVEADGTATVQTKGGMTLPGGDAAALTIGEKIVGDLGAGAAEGYIRAVAAATLAEVAVARGQIYGNSDPTNVEVIL